MRRVVGVGVLATVTAVAATTLVAALARTSGVGLEVSGEPIPLPGVGFVTGVCAVAGVALAAALLRWSVHPARHFVTVTLVLTAASLVPPLVAETEAATALTLVGLHLVAAVTVIPLLARPLRAAPSTAR